MKTCCQTPQVFVTLGDVRRIEAETGQTDFFDFRLPPDPGYTDQDDDPIWRDNAFQPDGTRRVLNKQANGDCTFLGSAGCVLSAECSSARLPALSVRLHGGWLLQRRGSGLPDGAAAARSGAAADAGDEPRIGRALAEATLCRAAAGASRVVYAHRGPAFIVGNSEGGHSPPYSGIACVTSVIFEALGSWIMSTVPSQAMEKATPGPGSEKRRSRWKLGCLVTGFLLLAIGGYPAYVLVAEHVRLSGTWQVLNPDGSIPSQTHDRLTFDASWVEDLGGRPHRGIYQWEGDQALRRGLGRSPPADEL